MKKEHITTLPTFQKKFFSLKYSYLFMNYIYHLQNQKKKCSSGFYEIMLRFQKSFLISKKWGDVYEMLKKCRKIYGLRIMHVLKKYHDKIFNSLVAIIYIQ